MEFNINGDVWIRLTGAGTRAYNLHYEKLGMEPPPLQRDSSDWCKFQLWDLMHIFGPAVYNGCQIPFVENVIRFKLSTV